jgi:hypothetical protein
MDAVRIRPGPAAAAAFRLGMVAAAVVGLAAIAALYWLGRLSLPVVGYALVFLFPVYLVVAASALSVWLGYAKDASALRPVKREAR